MIELKIESNDLIVDNLYVESENNVLITNQKTFLRFYKSFLHNNYIYLGNLKIDSRSAILINLLDYSSIINELTLKKGTLLYEYLIQDVIKEAEDNDLNVEFEEELTRMVSKVLLNKNLDYDIYFEADITKVITSYINFQINVDINNLTDIFNVLIKNLKNKNPKKKLILFVNKNIIDEKLVEMDDLLVFNINNQKEANILVADKIVNIDVKLIKNYINMNWPTEIKNFEINNIIESYLSNLGNFISTSNYKMYIGYILINKLLEIGIEVIYTGILDDVSESLISYVNQLLKK